VRDVTGHELLGMSSDVPKIDLYRIHDIEELSQPDLLRKLFDSQSQAEISKLNSEVQDLLGRLQDQRESIVAAAKKINDITLNENAPLRQYGKRKGQFNDVNNTEVQKGYSVVDRKARLKELLDKVLESWEKRSKSFAITQQNIDTFSEWFERLQTVLQTEVADDVVVEPFLQFLKGLSDQEGYSERTLNVLKTAKQTLEEGDARIRSEHASMEAGLRAARDLLVAKGLPDNAKDREVKKTSFEESENHLEEYKRHVRQINELLADRRRLVELLVTACRGITGIRKGVAKAITAKLASDLDSRVLVIEADAQPLKDQSKFDEWFLDVGKPRYQKFAEERFASDVEIGMSPDFLSAHLIPEKFGYSSDEEKPFSKPFKIAHDICRNLKVSNRHSPEVLVANENENLPVELRTGLLFFEAVESRPQILRLDAALRLDEVLINDQPVIRLNDRPLDLGSRARPIDELSPGQRCSAILPILLLTGSNPLVIDQPEDNLDNRLVRQVIVNILGAIKLKRQVIVATHNPNLPVLGDAEQIVVLRASGVKACTIDAKGDLHEADVVRYITDIMEGGREAFQYREAIYQPYWRGEVEP
jgi:nucleotide-binding universal stress UspA family protein